MWWGQLSCSSVPRQWLLQTTNSFRFPCKRQFLYKWLLQKTKISSSGIRNSNLQKPREPSQFEIPTTTPCHPKLSPIAYLGTQTWSKIIPQALLCLQGCLLLETTRVSNKLKKAKRRTTLPPCRVPFFYKPPADLNPEVSRLGKATTPGVKSTGHGSKSRTPSEHPNPHQNSPKRVVHLPQNGIPLVLTHSLLCQKKKKRTRGAPCLLLAIHQAVPLRQLLQRHPLPKAQEGV